MESRKIFTNIQKILQELQSDPFLKIKDDELVLRGIEPNSLRRWFKKHYKMTFHAYQRMLRINSAYHKICNGEAVTSTAYDAGYESLSGFTDTFKKTTGFSPSKSAHNHIVRITRILTPLGPMLAGTSDKGLCLLEFVDRRMLETQLKRLARTFTERYGTFSNQNDFENLEGLKVFMTDKL